MSCSMHCVMEIDGQATVGDPFEDYQNYTLYALLADVRNTEGVRPISRPRGLPDDATPEARALVEEYWGPDGYSTSWLTLTELLSADYDQTIASRGWVSPEEIVEQGTRMPLRHALGGWYFKFIEDLGARFDPNKVRFVFCFEG